MSIKCLMNGLEVNYPCSPTCALFGDCATAFEGQKKANVRTNADRIRAMSDEELAKVFTDTVASGCPPKMDWDCAKDKNGWDACDACWCKWLKQPAEGDC